MGIGMESQIVVQLKLANDKLEKVIARLDTMIAAMERGARVDEGAYAATSWAPPPPPR